MSVQVMGSMKDETGERRCAECILRENLIVTQKSDTIEITVWCGGLELGRVLPHLSQSLAASVSRVRLLRRCMTLESSLC